MDSNIRQNSVLGMKPLSSAILGVLFVLFLTFTFLLYPLLTLTITFYLFLLYLLIVNGRAGVLLLALSFPFVRNSYAALTGNYLPILFYTVFWLSLFLIFYANIIGFKIKLPSLMMDKYILLLTAYIFFSIVLFSSERAYGMEKFKSLATNIILFYLTVLLVQKEADLEQIFKAVLYFGIYFTLFSFLSYIDMEPFFGKDFAGRFSSLGINPIWMARYLSYAMLVEIYYILKFLPDWDKHIGKIAVLCGMIFLQMYMAMLTASRGPIAAMLLALVVLTLLYFRKNFRLSYLIGSAALIALLFVAVISFVPANVAQRLLSRDVSGQSTSMIRFVLNIEALLMFWRNKIFGIGFGGFNMFYLKYPHNIITEVLAELGAIGFTLLMAIFTLTLKYLWEIRNKIKTLNYYFIIAILVASFVNANLSGHIGSNFFFFLALSLVYAARQAAENSSD